MFGSVYLKKLNVHQMKAMTKNYKKKQPVCQLTEQSG
jgi:hypothetical protein